MGVVARAQCSMGGEKINLHGLLEPVLLERVEANSKGCENCWSKYVLR